MEVNRITLRCSASACKALFKDLVKNWDFKETVNGLLGYIISDYDDKYYQIYFGLSSNEKSYNVSIIPVSSDRSDYTIELDRVISTEVVEELLTLLKVIKEKE